MDTGAAILAGGQSRRIGRDKAWLVPEGQTFQGRIAAQLGCFPERLLSAAPGGSRELPGKKETGPVP